ncbi:MAG: Wzy polymerase domain-containing protein [Gallionella sp.]
MLSKIFRSIRPVNFKLAHISLALVGLMWAFPFLHYRHENPLTSFDQEWWSGMLGVLALTLLLAREFWQRAEIPRIAQLPAALIVVLLLQLVLGKVAYFNQALLYALYFLFATLLMVLGARLRDCFGLARLAQVLAIFLLIGAELNALIGVLQHFQWHTFLDPVIARDLSGGIYGNLAQPNHYADYLALGLISLGLLFQQRILKPWQVILLAVPMLFGMTLSGSRSSWLYMALMIFMSWWMARREGTMKPLLRYCALLAVGFGLMHVLVQMHFMAGPGQGTNTVQRLLTYNGGGDTGGSIRLYLWHEAWLMFAQSPWLGVGFGQFAWHHFQLLPQLQASNISGLYNNAHNLVFQLAAVAGISGLVALLGSLGIWLYGIRRVTLTAAHWWGYSLLGVLAIHSLLEYPLWYAYFVAVAAILLGAFDETRYRLELQNVGRVSMLAILLLGLVTLIQLRSGYQQLKNTLALRSASSSIASTFPLIRSGLIAAHDQPLLSPYAEMYMLAYTEVNSDHIKQKIALGDNVMRFLPIAPVVYRQTLFLAQGGQLAQAEQLMEQAIWSYPGNVYADKLLESLAEKDPAHFSALLKFAVEKEKEHARAVHHQ